MRGDFEQARAILQAGITNWKITGSRLLHNWGRANLGYVALREGNMIEACQIFSECAQGFQKNKNFIGVVFALEGMAGVFTAVGKPEQAAQLIGWQRATRGNIGDIRPRLEQADVDRDITTILSKIGNTSFEEAYNQGCAMTLDEVVAFATDKFRL